MRKQPWNQWPKILELVGACDEHGDCKRQGAQILLKLQILVRRDKYIELICRTAEELTVLKSRPAHLGDRFDGVTRQFAAQPTGK